MKRLTDRIKSGPFAGEAVCPTLYIHGTNMEECDTDVIQAMISRLAAYEDTGVEPGEVAALATERTCVTITIERSSTMKYTLEEWRKEGARRFGENHLDWKFVCPACGRVNAGHEFKEAGAKPDDMAVTCIGRHNGKGVSGMKCKKDAAPPEHGCDWAAFGLFGTLNGGDIVVTPEGKEVAAFEFAEVSA